MTKLEWRTLSKCPTKLGEIRREKVLDDAQRCIRPTYAHSMDPLSMGGHSHSASILLILGKGRELPERHPERLLCRRCSRVLGPLGSAAQRRIRDCSPNRGQLLTPIGTRPQSPVRLRTRCSQEKFLETGVWQSGTPWTEASYCVVPVRQFSRRDLHTLGCGPYSS